MSTLIAHRTTIHLAEAFAALAAAVLLLSTIGRSAPTRVVTNDAAATGSETVQQQAAPETQAYPLWHD